MNPDIFSYVKSQESFYETDEIQLGENWYWNMRTHIQMIFHLKHGQFFTGENNWLRAFKNIMLPMLNLAYWTEDLEVKDVFFYLEGKDDRVRSFLVKKYHDEVYVRENDLDTLFDEITESDLDYGGILAQKTKNPRPEVIALTRIAFCDQSDMLGGAIGFKFWFTPDKLRKMSKMGWGDKKNGATISLNELIELAKDTQDNVPNGKTNKTPSKKVEVYIVRGALPEHYLLDNDNTEDHYNQLHIIAFYTGKDKKKVGVTLYRKKDDEGSLKAFSSKPIDQRALGQGEGEALLHPQIWTNFLTIHKMALIEASSKVVLYTDDENFTDRNKVSEMDNLDVAKVENGRRMFQMPTASPTNIQIYQSAIDEWFQHAQLTGSANDPILGKEAPSGTTFRGQERSIAQGRGIHDRRRGQRAKFIEEIYRDWIIPDIQEKITDGFKFLATLSHEELTWVIEQLITNKTNERLKQMMIDGNDVSPEVQELLKSTLRDEFKKKGNKFIVEALKDEFAEEEIRMGINIANKQKDMSAMSDKILSIFQYIFANPQAFQQAMQIPALANSFQNILEYSGMNQADFMTITQPIPTAQPVAQPTAPQPQMTLA